MPLYHYRALRKDGTSYEGEAAVADKFALYSQIRAEGATPLVVTEHGRHEWFSFRYLNRLISTVKLQDKIVLTRNLAAMIESGLPLSRALSILERQATNPKLKSTLAEMEAHIRKGLTLHDALAKFPTVFSPLFVAMVKAGEESGSLAKSLQVVGMQMERAYALTRKVKGALIYPAIIVAAMVIIGILMMIYVVPTLSSTFIELGVELPPSTSVIIAVSDFLVAHTLVALLLLLMFGVGLTMAARTPRGQRVLEWTVLHIPVVGGIVKEVNAARTARTLSSLLSAGVDVTAALTITEEVLQNSFYKNIVAEVREHVKKGKTIAERFTSHPDIYPLMFGEMIAVGEETGELTPMLQKVADFYEAEVEQKTKDVSTIIEPFLMIVIGTGVGFFAYAMVVPIYSISSGL